MRNYTTLRWAGAAQNDFAARMRWTLTGDRRAANHAPRVHIAGSDGTTKVSPGETVRLRGSGVDPDRDRVGLRWWQYLEEGTYPGRVQLASPDGRSTRVTIPDDAQAGQTISVILQGADDGTFPLTRYDRVILRVR